MKDENERPEDDPDLMGSVSGVNKVVYLSSAIVSHSFRGKVMSR